MNFKKWVKSIQTAAYNGARTVFNFVYFSSPQSLLNVPIVLYEADSIDQSFILNGLSRSGHTAWSLVTGIIFLSARSDLVQNAQNSNFARIGPLRGCRCAAAH